MNIRIAVIVLSILPSSLLAQLVQKSLFHLPDTGEETSYTNSFGEDSDFSIYPPSFQINSDATVLDEHTKLQWQRADGGEMTIENARLYCDTLTLGGFNDWRLPTAIEAFSILNHQFTNPSLDVSVFTSSAAEYWWTSSKQVNDSTRIWVTNAGGGIGNHPKSETISAGGNKRFHVRAVRSDWPVETVEHFVSNANASVSDQLSGLVWQQMALPDSMTWESALQFADTCTFAGINNWRLPNIKELQSLSNPSLINPTINPAYFPNIGLLHYWSSTTLPNQTSKAWYLDTHFGITTYQVKTAKLSIILVSGNDSLVLSLPEIKNQLNAFPNPFTQTIHVKENTLYYLMDAQGRCIYQGYELEKQDLSALPSGIYILKNNCSNSPAQYLIKE